LRAERPPESIQQGSFAFVRGPWHSKIDNKSTDLYSIASYFSLWGLELSLGWLSPKKLPHGRWRDWLRVLFLGLGI